MFKNVNEKQRWSLRKLTIGMASVMLGTMLFVTAENTMPAISSSHVVMADEDPISESSSGVNPMLDMYGVDNRVSHIYYVGHTTANLSNGGVQDIYKYRVFNNNIQVKRLVSVKGIFGMHNNDIGVQFQAANSDGSANGSANGADNWSDAGGANETHQYTANVDEGKVKYSQNIYVYVKITRANPGEVAGFKDIAAVSQGNHGSTRKPQISDQAFAISDSINKVASIVPDSDSQTVDVKQQVYAVNDNPVNKDASDIPASDIEGFNKDQVKTIKFNSDSIPNTKSVTTAPQTATATVTYTNGETASVKVPYIVIDVKAQSYKKGSEVSKLKASDVEGVDASKISEVDWVIAPNTDQDEGTYSDAKAKITFTDGSTKEVTVNYTITETSAQKIKPNIPDKTLVDDKSNLTDTEKETVKGKVEDANKDVFPKGTTVEIGNDGTATITYPDGSTDTIPGSKLVEEKTSSTANITVAQQTYKVGDKPTTVDASQASGTGSDEIKTITYDKAPDTSIATSDAKTAKATVTFNDNSTVTVDVPYVVTDIASTDGKDASVNDQTYKKGAEVPDLKTTDVAGVDSDKVKSVEWVTKPNTDQDEGSYSDAKAKITFTDGSTKEVTVNYKITETQADKIKPNTPDKTPVDDIHNLTPAEKEEVKGKVEDVNKDNFPEGTTVEIGDDGTATITYPDGSKDTIPGSDLVCQKVNAEKPKLVYVDKYGQIDDNIKSAIKDAIKEANPSAKTINVKNDGSADITFEDDTVAILSSSDTTYTLNYPYKTLVRNKEQLTQSEKDFVAKVIKEANPDLASKMNVTISDQGDATITFNDGKHEDATMDKKHLVNEGNWLPNRTYVEKMGQPTDAEKQAIVAAIVEGNIDPNTGKSTVNASDVKVREDGSALVDHGDGADPAYIIKEHTTYTINIPEITYVNDIHHISSAEQQDVIKKIKDANPDIAKDVDSKNSDWSIAINPDGGEATITFGNGEKYSAAPTIPGKSLVAENKLVIKDQQYSVNDDPSEVSLDQIDANASEHVKVKDITEIKYNTTLVTSSATEAGETRTAEATVTFRDGSTKVVTVKYTVVDNRTDAEKITPSVPDKTVVYNDTSLTPDEKRDIAGKITDANKDKFPEGTTVTVDDKGNATITYPDKSTDTIPGTDLVFSPKLPTMTEVADKTNLTDAEKNTVKDKIEKANEGNFPEGTKVEIGKDGSATITYGDSSITIPGSQLVYEKDKTDAEKYDAKVNDQHYKLNEKPAALTLSDLENSDHVKSVVWKSEPKTDQEGTFVDKASATVTFQDGSSKDVAVKYTVTDDRTDADKIDVKVNDQHYKLNEKPAALTLSDLENSDHVKSVVWKSEPKTDQEGTFVDKASATVTFQDGSSKDVAVKYDVTDDRTDADKIDVKIPEKTAVDDIHHLTPAEKAEVEKKVEDANKDNFPEGTKVEIADDGAATITFPDGSQTTIPGEQLVYPKTKGDTKTDADKITPNVPDKTGVDDIHHLTPAEKEQVKDKVEDANKGNFPDGTKVEIADDGKATITYPDGSKDTIPGEQLVYQNNKGNDDKGNQTDADKITPNVPDKTGVDDIHNLTPAEKAEVEKKVEDANKDKFPDGTKVEIGNDGTATITYPDGSKDTISGDQLVYQKDNGGDNKGDTKSDADRITPNVPGKTGVDDTHNLTPAEKEEVKDKVEDANKDLFPEGTTVEIGNDGTATITYPDGSKDTISGDQLVYDKDKDNSGDNKGDKGTDADRITPNVPGKTSVDDTHNLTPAEKEEVKDKVEDANKDLFPEGTTVEIGNDGTATITYPDGSKDTIPGDQLVEPKNNSNIPAGDVEVPTNGDKNTDTPKESDADKITPNLPDKTEVDDIHNLTPEERDQVKKAIEDANKDIFPAGTDVEIAVDGTATITYPDGSKDIISGKDLVKPKTATDTKTNGDKHTDSAKKSGANKAAKSNKGDKMSTNASSATADSNAGVKANNKRLPQTGSNGILSIIGAILISLATLVGFKKKED